MFELIQFKTPSIVFGMDTINQIRKEAKKLGADCALLVTGPRIQGTGLVEKAVFYLKTESIAVEVHVEDRETPEPATSVVEETAEVAKNGNFDVITGLGACRTTYVNAR